MVGELKTFKRSALSRQKLYVVVFVSATAKEFLLEFEKIIQVPFYMLQRIFYILIRKAKPM